MAQFQIPLEKSPYYSFTTELDSQIVRLTLKWNGLTQAWYMHLEGVSFGLDIRGVKLVCGVNLLHPYPVDELGQLHIIDIQGKNADPDFENIDTRFQLIYTAKVSDEDI